MTKDGKPWTTILVDLREQAPMPEPTNVRSLLSRSATELQGADTISQLARFLTTCLGFTTSIRTISSSSLFSLLARGLSDSSRLRSAL